MGDDVTAQFTYVVVNEYLIRSVISTSRNRNLRLTQVFRIMEKIVSISCVFIHVNNAVQTCTDSYTVV